VLVLSQYVNESYALRLLGDSAAGVGYLLKQRVLEPVGFVDAVRQVARGGLALDPEVVSQMLERRARGGPVDLLTEHERAVLAGMAEGRSNPAIARELGMGEPTSLVTLCELGDVRRLSASRKAVRMAGIEIGLHRCDRRARAGKLTRQGSPQLRWALYEAALAACRPSSPDHTDHQALKARGLSHTRASLTIARKLARRSYHVLRELGPDALDPVTNA
jgi:transposase